MKTLVKNIIHFILKRFSYTRNILSYYTPGVPPGHFYSPIPDINQVNANQKRIYNRKEVKDINLNKERQFELLNEFIPYYKNCPYKIKKSDGYRYYYENSMFSYSDAIILNCIIQHFKPNHIIEVGSGYSSAAMLDVDGFVLNHNITFEFIEPFPDNRLLKLLNDDDFNSGKVVLHKKTVQEIPVSNFNKLNTNDILFIDSSHVAKIDSDVCFLLFEIFPILNSGVIIHIHDVFYPFEYPLQWIKEGNSWNEAYMIRAFLQNNNDYEIIYFNSYMEIEYEEWIKENMPDLLKLHTTRNIGNKIEYLNHKGQSIWLRKR